MTVMDGLISQHGASGDIYRESEGAAGSYGDPAPTWSKQATETVWIQKAQSIRGSRIFASIAGEIDESTYIGFFKSDSVVAEDDYVLKGGVKYGVAQVVTVKQFGAASHIEAHLRLMEEG